MVYHFKQKGCFNRFFIKPVHAWLDSYHIFSFGSYYNPGRMNFGVLRVLNDDTVSGGMGFGKHPYENMEIISIPLEGNLEHFDNMGNHAVIRQDDIQAMNAGTGKSHSEKNESSKKPVKFLQIWILPDRDAAEFISLRASLPGKLEFNSNGFSFRLALMKTHYLRHPS
ncbi:MAG: pirin family protein [Chitinophagales bacterium]